ncbi:MAG: reverse transcriptase domain-containing protein, partial [Plesiomonas sp.]|uniref:reverse transcriptase domain-containing protein n=1 Tax=Plesiomonas sp. TaxID=2486279 RepID=UPI003F37B4CA
NVKRGIRQGCPLSGMLYAIAIEPLLRRLRQGLTGLTFATAENVRLSAYADDVTVFIRGQDDIQVLKEQLALYERASSAKVNWSKCEGLLLGEWTCKQKPNLPAGLQWSREGMKCLGVFLGNNDFQKKNWEGLAEKISARLSRWTWVQPQLSYRGRVLVANNLAASMLWHRFTVLDPPDTLVREIQKRLVDFFWGGYHWTRAAVLFLPLFEGGQGLVDLQSRISTFRLQTIQRFLYGELQMWTGTAAVLLRRVNNLGYDKQLFLSDLTGMEITEATPFYQSTLQAWATVLKAKRDCSDGYGNVEEEPLFHNPFVQSRLLSSASVKRVLITAGLTKLAGLRSEGRWKDAATLCRETGLRSLRLLERLLAEVKAALPGHFRRALAVEAAGAQQPLTWPAFPSLSVSAAVEEQEEGGAILSFKTPELADFPTASKKALYTVAVKVLNSVSLQGVRESRWVEMFAPASSPRGSWRSLY